MTRAASMLIASECPSVGASDGLQGFVCVQVLLAVEDEEGQKDSRGGVGVWREE